jgi:hypothetical protein
MIELDYYVYVELLQLLVDVVEEQIDVVKEKNSDLDALI